jgi:ribonuclease Z
MIDVALLGTGGMMPLPHRWLSSLLVRVQGELTLFDCGEGTQIAWRQTGWSMHRLGAICISHTHADHIAGLPGLLHAVANTGRTEPVTIYGPPGLQPVVAGLRTIAPYLPYPMHVVELESGEGFALPGGLDVRCVAGVHALPVLAYRLDLPRKRPFLVERAVSLGLPRPLWSSVQNGNVVEWEGQRVGPNDVLGPERPGISLAYVTDTRPTAEIAELVAGVDLLVSEATYGDDADADKAVRNTHMTFREAATLAKSAGAGRLWLTHFSPGVEVPAAWLANAEEVFANTVVGSDGLVATLNFRARAVAPVG